MKINKTIGSKDQVCAKGQWQEESHTLKEVHTVVIGLRSLVLTACHFSMSAHSRCQVQRSVAILAQAFGSSPSPGPVAHSVMERKAASSFVGRFSAKAAAELGQHLVEEHQSPFVIAFVITCCDSNFGPDRLHDRIHFNIRNTFDLCMDMHRSTLVLVYSP